MREYTLFVLVFVCVAVFASGIQAATVMIDPATLDSPEAGGEFAVSVKAENVSGMFAYQFDLVFDRTAIKFSGIEAGEFLGNDGVDTLTFLRMSGRQVYFDVTPEMLAFLASSGQAVETEITPNTLSEINSAGKLTVIGTRLGSDANVSGTGILVTTKFQVLKVKDSTLQIQNVELGTSAPDSEAQFIPTDVKNGVIVVPEIKGDLNGDRKVGSDDAVLVLRFIVGLETLTDHQKLMADMNSDDRIGADDVILILRKAIGLAAPGADAIANAGRQINVTLDEPHGVAGESIIIPVKVDHTSGLAGGSISICYNQKVLHAVNASLEPGVLLVSNLNTPGMLRLAFAIMDGLNSKTLTSIRFDILADDTSPLTFKTVMLYGLDGLPLDSRGTDVLFTSWAAPPERSALLQNFPNPFNPDTWIPYQISRESDVSITIYDAVGRMVRHMDLGRKPAGTYRTQERAAHWNGRNQAGELVASGVYFVVLKAENYQETRSVVLIR